MIGLGERQREAVQTGAMELARETLKDAVVEGIEEAEASRSRRSRGRRLIGSVFTLGVGAAVGYALRGREGEVAATVERAELPDEALEMVPDAAETVPGAPIQREQEQQSSGQSGVLSKLGVITVAAAGLYLLRRREGSTQEMVQQATQRARDVGDQAEERSQEIGEQTEAVAGGASDRLDQAGEQIGEGAAGAGEAVSEGVDDAAGVAEDVQEDAEEATDEANEE